MKISAEQAALVADLANLDLSPEQMKRITHDLEEILTHMETLNRIDTTGVEPMAQVLFDAAESPLLRPDEPRPGIGVEGALANAPLAGSGYFKVPKVIER